MTSEEQRDQFNHIDKLESLGCLSASEAAKNRCDIFQEARLEEWSRMRDNILGGFAVPEIEEKAIKFSDLSPEVQLKAAETLHQAIILNFPPSEEMKAWAKAVQAAYVQLFTE